MKIPRIRVRFKKLGREKAYGQAHSDGLIEIDPRQGQRVLLDTLIHELLHILEPDWSEAKVTRTAKTLTHYIWKSQFRRISD